MIHLCTNFERLCTAGLQTIPKRYFNICGHGNISLILQYKKDYEYIETQTLFGFIPLQHNGHKYLKSSNRYGALNKSESQVLYKLKQNSGADIILDPEFTSERHSWFLGLYKTTKITVDGWAVKVNKLHN